MKIKTGLLAIIATTIFLGAVEPALACSCRAKPTVLEEFDQSADVIIAEIKSMEKAPPSSTDDDDTYLNGIAGAKMTVVKAFKGDLKEGSEVFFEQGGGANCIWTYEPEMVGGRVLIYNSPYEGKRYVSECGRSNSLSFVSDDLRYLENLDRLRGKTRISGTYRFGFGGGAPPGHSVNGKKIKITGTSGAFTAVTDKDGVYELYDLPPGDYFIEPEVPAGWKLDRYMLEHTSSIDPDYLRTTRNTRLDRLPVTVSEGKHIMFDFQFEIDNSISGRVLNPQGKPMEGVCVSAIAIDAPDDKFGPFDCTNEKGSFLIRELYRERVVLVINGDGKVTGDEPIEKLFYPGVTERSKATVIKIVEGTKSVLPAFRIPRLVPTVVLSGVLRYVDGSLVTSRQKVQFVADQITDRRETAPYDYTDDKGWFEIKILKGQTGKIRGEMIFGNRDLENCKDLKDGVLIEKWSVFTAATKWAIIKADRDQETLELKFSFRQCERK